MRDFKETANKITASLSYDFFVRALEVITHPLRVTAKPKPTALAHLHLLSLLKKKKGKEIPRERETEERANLQSTQANPL